MNEITREIRFEYAKEKTPVDIFKEYTLMLAAFEKAEIEVAKSISTSMQYKSSLEAVETGSVITRIKSWIEDKEPELDDGTLQSIDIQKYISDGLKTIVDNLANDKNVTKETISKMCTDLDNLAKSTKISERFSYTPIQQKTLIDVSKSIKVATSNLAENEKVYLTEKTGNNIELPKQLNIQVTEKDITNNERTIKNETEQILKIKKPDYIADSAWELKFGKTYKNIKIEDSKWINNFLNKEIKLYPGDSIRCKVLSIDEYDSFGTLVNSKISITEVLEIIEGIENDE